MSDSVNEHDPQPVRVTDGEEICGSRWPRPGEHRTPIACTYPPGHGPLVDLEGYTWAHGLLGKNTLWTGRRMLRGGIERTDGWLPPDADPPPPGLAARSLAAMDPEGDAVQHQGGEDAEIRDCVIRWPSTWSGEDIALYQDHVRCAAVRDSAGVTAAHLTARRAVEDMATAHREQLGEARAATRKAADEAERWRVEAEAARAQVGTLTAERDRYRTALLRIFGDGAVFVSGVGNPAALANGFRRIAREALGTAREETT